MDILEDPSLRRAMEKLHIKTLRPFQILAVTDIIEPDRPKDALIILPTGSGKTACFILPSLLLEGITVVVYPLLSLMNDQAKRLSSGSIPFAVLRGGQTKRERNEQFGRLRNGAKILITNPETILQPKILGRLKEFRISLLVADEAHTVSEWGSSFRPAYRKFALEAETLNAEKHLAFTATADKVTERFLRQTFFHGRPPHIIRASIDRENITYCVRRSLSGTHDTLALIERCEKPALVFCRSRLRCEQLAFLIKMKMTSSPVRYYHAGLPKSVREDTERWFANTSDGILIGTNAFGMGVDVKGIRTVIHREPAPSASAFLQESGRAGRDGNPSLSYTLINEAEQSSLRLPKDLLSVYLSKTECIREGMLRLMGSSAISGCSGCDVCNGTVFEEPDGEKEILSAIRRRPLHFSASSLSYFLTGLPVIAYNPARNNLLPLYGSLSDWRREDLEEAIHTLISLKKIIQTPISGKLFLPLRLRFGVKWCLQTPKERQHAEKTS